jgi:AcrR family transcriptional regulator
VPHPSARKHILQEGLKLACTRGLCRVTFGAVATHARVSKSGIVAHFSSVEGLKRAIIDRALDLWKTACFGAAKGTQSGITELSRYLSGWMNWTNRAGLPGACPIALALFEYTSIGNSGPARLAVSEAEGHWRTTLIELIEGAIATSGLPPGIDVPQMAWDLLGVYLTHHVSRHLLRTPEADQFAQRSIQQVIRRAGRPG